MLDFIMTNIDTIFIVITSVVTGASAIAAVTPNKSDDKIVAAIKKIADFLALNIGNAKTASKQDSAAG